MIESMARFGITTCSCGGIQVGGGQRKLIRGGDSALLDERSVVAFKKSQLYQSHKMANASH